MKRIVWFVIVACLVCVLSFSFAPTAMADTVAPAYDPYPTFETLAGFDRTVSKSGAKQTADWLVAALAEMGYTAQDGSALQPTSFTFESTTSTSYYSTEVETFTCYNVVAYKLCGKQDAQLLVIGAPYDNEQGLLVDGVATGCKEVLYSASSAATLLSIADSLKSNSLSYDVAFAFWGASYFGYRGTSAFLKSNRQSLLGYIDLSFVAGGDYLNIYYDETTRTYGQYVDSILAKYEQFSSIQHKPFDPGYTAATVGDYPYGHVGIEANGLFLLEGVPSIRLFGYNWDAHCETSRGSDVLLTTSDTLENAISTYGKDTLQSRMTLAKDLVVRLVLTDKDFATVLADSRKDATGVPLITAGARYGLTYSVVGLVVVLVVVAGVLLMRRSKAAGVPDFSVNSEFVNGEVPVDAGEDVFGEGSKPEADPIQGNPSDVSGEKDDFDDIFGEH